MTNNTKFSIDTNIIHSFILVDVSSLTCIVRIMVNTCEYLKIIIKMGFYTPHILSPHPARAL